MPSRWRRSCGTSCRHVVPPTEASAAARRARWRRAVVLLVAAACVAAAGWLGFAASARQGTEALRAQSDHQLELFAGLVQGLVRRLEYVPATLQLQPQLQALLREPADAVQRQAASDLLRRLNAYLGSAQTLVLDARGVVLAASEPRMQGGDLSVQPYVLDALNGRVGRHYAVDPVDGVPGYYVSHPLHDGARVAGVAVLKIGLAAVDQAWAGLGAPALLADSNQVVVMSSRPEWRYTALTELTPEQQAELQRTRQYGGRHIARLPLQLDLRIDEDSQVVEGVLPQGLGGPGAAPVRPESARGVLVLGRTLDGMDWRLLVFTDLRAVRGQAWRAALLAALGTACALLLAQLVLQRQRIVRQKLRSHAELESQVALRTQDLQAANTRLRREVAEREQAEQTLRRAQDELVHAGKMAALGQLATGITHELTQPLGAIRTLSANAVAFMQRGEPAVAAQNLDIMARLAEQMGAIIEPLKGFARKSQARPQATDVALACQRALFLLQQRLRREGVELIDSTQPGQVLAWCDPNRLEQVLLNLIGNALDAMSQDSGRRVWISANADADAVRIQVRDAGPGMAPEVREHLFEPFFSTKAEGAGLGLGLAISRDIAREAGGELSADNHPEGGACFTLRLPLPPAP
jgi:C4-dicarboxylate-specific signal transduction histidine kinase